MSKYQHYKLKSQKLEVKFKKDLMQNYTIKVFISGWLNDNLIFEEEYWYNQRGSRFYKKLGMKRLKMRTIEVINRLNKNKKVMYNYEESLIYKHLKKEGK